MSDKDNELIERALILFNEGPDEWTRQEGFEAANILKSIATRLHEVKEENAKLKEKYSPTYHDVEEFYKDE